MQMSCWS